MADVEADGTGLFYFHSLSEPVIMALLYAVASVISPMNYGWHLTSNY